MKESILTEIFLHAGFFLGLSALVIPLLRYFKVPISLGYLLAGIALGPFALGSIADSHPSLEILRLNDAEHVKILAEMGIVLLLFVIGLELTPRRLWQMRSLVFGLGSAQVILTALTIGLIAFFWGNNIQVSILLGLSFALSSTAIVTQWLHEQKLFVSHAGRASFSILLLQDLAIIPILILLTILGTDIGENITGYISFTLFKMIVTVFAIYFLGKLALKPVFVFASKHGGSEVFMALSLLIIVFSASIASMAGLSMALGAFIAGLIIADTEYRHEISALIIPFKSMLLGIFFLSFGMGINLTFLTEKPIWLACSVLGLMVIKTAITFTLCKLWKQTTAVSLESALLLSQAGEFGLLVVGTSLTMNLMEENVGQFMLITVGITMLIAPILAPIARKVGQHLENHSTSPQDAAENEHAFDQHIIIFGYGRIGRHIGERLSKEGFNIIGFDKSIEKVNAARTKSTPIYYGDASKVATINAASIDTAQCIVITLDNAKDTQKIIQIIRKRNTNVPIVVRGLDKASMLIFSNNENTAAIAEDILIGTAISEKIVDLCKFSAHEKADETISQAN